MNSNPFLIFLVAMMGFYLIKPQQFYSNGKLKTWHDINLDRPETLYNIYVYAIVVAIFAHYMD